MNFIADMHTHTCASTHAYSTVTENAKWASEHGIKYLGMTDHSVDMWDAPHVWHFYNQRILPDELFGVRLIRGIEADIIDNDGNLDIYENYLYECLEWINVSMHDCVIKPSSFSEHTRAYMAVLDNKYVDVLCHTDYARFAFDVDAVCRKCAENGKLMEVNVNRLKQGGEKKEYYKRMLDSCVRHGTSIIVNSDAHFYTNIGAFDCASTLIEETGFPAELVLNSDTEKIERYLKNRAARLK